MSGMNVIFHLVSALGAVLLVYLLLRAQRERDFLKDLLGAAGTRRGPHGTESRGVVQRGRVHVEPPVAFLERFAGALGVPFESDEGALSPVPRRIAAGPLVDLFLRAGIGLIRCRKADGQGLLVELELAASADAFPRGDLEARLAAALGGEAVRVVILPGQGKTA